MSLLDLNLFPEVLNKICPSDSPIRLGYTNFVIPKTPYDIKKYQVLGSGTCLSASSTISSARTLGCISRQNHFTRNSKTIFHTRSQNYCTTKCNDSGENIKPVCGGINLVHCMIASVVGFGLGSISCMSYMGWKSSQVSEDDDIYVLVKALNHIS